MNMYELPRPIQKKKDRNHFDCIKLARLFYIILFFLSIHNFKNYGYENFQAPCFNNSHAYFDLLFGQHNVGIGVAAPTAYVGNVITENGEYYKVMLVLENVTTSNITIRVVNVSSDAVSFSGVQWKIMAIGAF